MSDENYDQLNLVKSGTQRQSAEQETAGAEKKRPSYGLVAEGSDDRRTGEAVIGRAAAPLTKTFFLVIALLASISIAPMSVDRDSAEDESAARSHGKKERLKGFDHRITANAEEMIDEGRKTVSL